MATHPSSTDYPPAENPYAAPETMAPPGEAHVFPAYAANSDAPLPPALYRDSAFWGTTATQFLGAFNDNVFKQLLLLLSVGAAAGGAAADRQWIAMLVFSAPFLMFSGFAGFVSDRIGKRLVIVGSKVGEVVIMLLGMAGFALLVYVPSVGYPMLLAVLFLMGGQSAMFGPAKYGILPELFRRRDLPRVNGIFLMTTFLAIIFGTAVAGVLRDAFGPRLWVGSTFCVAIAIVGTVTALIVRSVPPAQPKLPFGASVFLVPRDMRALLKSDGSLCRALLVYSTFWLVAGIAHPAVNALGKIQLGLSDTYTSYLAASIGLGIAAGCVLACAASRGKINFAITRIGAWGIICCLVLVSLPGRGGTAHLLGFRGSLPVLIALGVFTGMFTVPLQVFLQDRPPQGKKGRLIAVMNQANWLAIFLSALVYFLFDRLLLALAWPRSGMFALTAILMLPIALFFRPENEELA